MNAPVYSAHTAKHILLVSDTEDAMRTEMQTLTSLGALRFEHCPSVKEVLHAVKPCAGRQRPAFDLILCAEALGGESIYVLLRQLAMDKGVARLPVLLVASTPQSAAMANEAGLVVLSRPYSQARCAEALSHAMSAMRKPLSSKALGDVCARLTPQNRLRLPKSHDVCKGATSGKKAPASHCSDKNVPVRTSSDIMQEGLAHLRAGALDKAEVAFLSLVRRSYDNAEAYLGLARVRGRQKKTQESVECLVRAAAAFKRQKKHEKAKAVYAMLPESMQTGHIFLQEAGLCLRRKEFREAALSILEHLYEHPEARLHLVVGRLCQLTKAPEDSLKKLCETYTHLGYTSIARRLHTQLMAELTPVAYDKPGWLDHYPRLREIIEVASYTTALWRQA